MVRASERFVGKAETTIDHCSAFDGASLSREAVVDLHTVGRDGANDTSPFNSHIALSEAGVGRCEVAGASQFVASDLVGGYAERTFKLPNPVYFLP